MTTDADPVLMALDSTREQAEQALKCKALSSTPPWPLHQLLSQRSCPVCSCPDFLNEGL